MSNQSFRYSSNLLTELDNKLAEVFSGGQQGPLVFYGCPQDRYVTNHDGKYWFRGARGCDVFGRNAVPQIVRPQSISM